MFTLYPLLLFIIFVCPFKELYQRYDENDDYQRNYPDIVLYPGFSICCICLGIILGFISVHIILHCLDILAVAV